MIVSPEGRVVATRIGWEGSVSWIQEVLVEALNPKNPEQVMGRTEHNKIAFFPADLKETRGKLIRVKVNSATASCLHCTAIG